MAVNSVDLIHTFLEGRNDIDVIRSLCTPDVTYVSLNYSNPDLERSMPWCGTHKGPEAIMSTFDRVARYWSVDDFSPEAVFGDEQFVAAFGRMTLTSTVMGKTVTSPFSLFCRLTDGKVSYMQFMEDTFATSSTFRSGGQWVFRSNPAGGEVTAPSNPA